MCVCEGVGMMYIASCGGIYQVGDLCFQSGGLFFSTRRLEKTTPGLLGRSLLARQCPRNVPEEKDWRGKSSHRHRGKSAARGTSRQVVPKPAPHSCPPVSPALQLSFPPAPNVPAHRLSSSMADHGRAVCMPYAETCVKSMPYFSVFHFLS